VEHGGAFGDGQRLAERLGSLLSGLGRLLVGNRGLCARAVHERRRLLIRARRRRRLVRPLRRRWSLRGTARKRRRREQRSQQKGASERLRFPRKIEKTTEKHGCSIDPRCSLRQKAVS